MKKARVRQGVLIDEALKKEGFDLARPFKVEPVRAEEEDDGWFQCTQHDPEDKDAETGDTTCAENRSGIVPVEYKVLIARPDVENTTEGGIVIPKEIAEKEKFRRISGLLVAKGGNAFEDWKDPVPKVGQLVRMAKYVGEFFKGADGRTYQMISDKDISGVFTEEFKEEYYPTGQADHAGDGQFSHLRTQRDPEEMEERFRKTSMPGQERIRVFMSK